MKKLVANGLYRGLSISSPANCGGLIEASGCASI